MTIKEMETRVGMTRANIRYYEKEELLAPGRQENGYRDYSEEDVNALLKIKLLRQLHIPVEEIRALARGERALGETFSQQLNELQAQQSALTQAEDLCRAMCDDRVTYDTLDPVRYLTRVPQETPRDKAYFTIERDRTPPVSHPWRRYLARAFDLSLYSVLWTLLLVFAWRVNPLLRSPAAQLFDGLLVLLAMLFLEPLCLWLFAATPGKALFGLRITDASGGRLSYWNGLSRTLSVLWSGMGFGIPIYSLVRLWKSYRTCEDGFLLRWEEDGDFHEAAVYTLRDTSRWRGAAWLLATTALLWVTVFGVQQGSLPPHRGTLPVAQFVENYNDMARYWKAGNGMDLTERGGFTTPPDSTYHAFAANDPPRLTFTEQDGVLTAVGFTVESHAQQSFFLGKQNEMTLITLAFAGAQAGAHPGTFLKSELLSGLSGGGVVPFSLSYNGFSSTCEVETKGYEQTFDSSRFFVPIEGQAQYFRIAFLLAAQ